MAGAWCAAARGAANRESARCAYRHHGPPGDRHNNLGFRVLCVSPIF
jgi:formylglycine-generating enzyme required for sulfatase activity